MPTYLSVSRLFLYQSVNIKISHDHHCLIAHNTGGGWKPGVVPRVVNPGFRENEQRTIPEILRMRFVAGPLTLSGEKLRSWRTLPLTIPRCCRRAPGGGRRQHAG
ncbi:hypothetical protein CEXT_59041 [Caerostris extrusa]|uniref:Uncharacterized protein n=1 Tax=Caerostris extrusa TaxID=172846 RepID=A0AAV4PBG3_CAEEX|nr:hypothetical protein CEXT_59041 [Caerostris extrusa]